MIYGDRVYDFTDYISSHDRFMDIREWCGLDMTEDFETKAGIGRDHRESTYAMLDSYYIGDLVVESIEPESIVMEDISEVSEQDDIEGFSNPYNLLVPLVLTSLIYWSSYFVFKKKLKKFNAFWNTVLLLTLLVPSFGFGIFMMLRYRFRDLYNLDFDVMYWHVELSVVMGVIAISHLIQRFKQYLVQLRK
jgi:hypothetical protein